MNQADRPAALTFVFAVLFTFFAMICTEAAHAKITKKTSDWAVPFQLPIRISSKQNIVLKYSAGSFSVDGLKEGKPQLLLSDVQDLDVLNKQIVVSIGDLNFDGFTDIAIDQSYGYGGSNISTAIYFWLPQKNRFTTDGFTIFNFTIDEQRKTLNSVQLSGPRWYRSEYKFDNGLPWKFHETIGPGIIETHTYYDKAGNETSKIIARPVLKNIKPTPATLPVIIPRAYLFKQPDEKTKLTSYLVKGDKITVLDQAGDWGQWLKVRNLGKSGTVGWMKLEAFDKGE